MSRLYLKANSDTRKNQVTSQGNEEVTASIYWGSKGNSMLAATVTVFWPKGSETPKAIVEMGKDVLRASLL
jgi:hypothetical protein